MSVKDEGSLMEQHRAIMENDDASSDLSDAEHFLTRGAFLLTPATELQMERVSIICEKMSYKGPFSLTKTATGILFKFADPEDYQLTFKKGFHKVTGSRFYKKIPIPCRPQKTFSIFVFEVPEEVPEEDIRHSLYKFRSIVEVCRLPPSQSASGNTSSVGTKTTDRSGSATAATGGCSTEISCMSSSGCVTTTTAAPSSGSSPPVIRVTLASLDECNVLLRDGLDFYGATYFPTEPALSTSIARAGGKKTVMHNRKEVFSNGLMDSTLSLRI